MPPNQDELEKKAFRLREFALVLAGALVALSCHHAPVKNTPIDDSPSTSASATPVVPAGPAVSVATSGQALARPLTAFGENSQARYSPDGTRIAYISRLRANHKQAQIYELHLQRMTEKRVTFHDGDDSAPSYAWDGQHFLFASTTDAIKEEEFAAEKLMKTYYPSGYEKRVKAEGEIEVGSELYSQTLNGRTIERLTKGTGTNAEPDSDPKGRRVLFTSVRGVDKLPHVYVMSGKNQLRLTSGAGVADHSPRFSNDGKNMVFTQKGEGGGWRLFLATGDLSKAVALGGVLTSAPLPTATPIPTAMKDVDPIWNLSGDEVIFASNRGGTYLNLFSIDRKGECLRRLTTADFDQREPALSPDGKHLLFTGHFDGHDHIFEMDHSKPAACWTSGAAAAVVIVPKGSVTASSAGASAAPSAATAPTRGSAMGSTLGPGLGSAPASSPEPLRQ